MRFIKPPPTTLAQNIPGSISFAYGPNGQVTARKWPKNRPGPLPPTTEQQTAQWDDAMQAVKFALPQQQSKAAELVAGTGYYTRDILISAMYGHVYSWPGWGVYPDGPAGAPLYVNSRGNPTYPPRGPDDPQKTNILTAWNLDTVGDPYIITASTRHPTRMSVMRFCTPRENILVRDTRRGMKTPHGYKFWFAKEPHEYISVTGVSLNHEIHMNAGDFGAVCPNCTLIACEPGVKPILEWESLEIPCPPPPVAPGRPPKRGYYWMWTSVAATAVDEEPPPIIVNQNNQVQDSWIAAGTGRGYQIINDVRMQNCGANTMTLAPPFGPIYWGSLGTNVIPYNATTAFTPTCGPPTTPGWNWYWWLQVKV